MFTQKFTTSFSGFILAAAADDDIFDQTCQSQSIHIKPSSHLNSATIPICERSIASNQSTLSH